MGQRHSSDPRAHPWWQHVPAGQRPKVLGRRRRDWLLQWLAGTQGKAVMLLALFISLMVAIALVGAGWISLLALLPLVLLPALAYLIYWLTWQEFHR